VNPNGALTLLALIADLLGLNLFGDRGWLHALVQNFVTLSLMDLVQWGMGMTLVLTGLVAAVLWPEPV